MPQYQTDTLQGLGNLPITNTGGSTPQILDSLAAIHPGQESATVSHYNVQSVIDIYGSVQGRDLGGVSKDINKALAATKKDLPRGTRVVVRGQVQTMNASFIGLLGGLDLFDRAGLSAHRYQLPVMAGPVCHHRSATRGPSGNSLVSLSYPHDAQRPCANRIHHVHGRCDSKQHPRRELR